MIYLKPLVLRKISELNDFLLACDPDDSFFFEDYYSDIAYELSLYNSLLDKLEGVQKNDKVYGS